MRPRPFSFIVAGILSMGLLACHPPKQEARVKPPMEPPPGWRVARQEPRRNIYSATFVPKQRTTQEKMWVTILQKPEFLSKSTDELLQVFQPRFICQNRDLNVLKKDHSEILFEEKDTVCYGQANRYTMGRITKGTGSVSYFAYRADLAELPGDRRDFVMKALTSAPLDASGGAAPANSNTAPGGNSSTGAGATSE